MLLLHKSVSVWAELNTRDNGWEASQHLETNILQMKVVENIISMIQNRGVWRTAESYLGHWSLAKLTLALKQLP